MLPHFWDWRVGFRKGGRDYEQLWLESCLERKTFK